MKIGLGIYLATRRLLSVGPIVTTPASVSPSTAEEGVQATRTQGSYSARGGGSVSITTSEWRIDGVQVSTSASYTPGAGQIGGVLTYVETATETGGTAAGAITRTITLGTVTAAGGGNTWILDSGSWDDAGLWDDTENWKDAA